ncbi:hypothetical protein C8R44DRAFT_732942 [Mycena epipterygia]|nr:hypothetical protein C8R44DRAFT_732942 [Mycena epipterygia]
MHLNRRGINSVASFLRGSRHCRATSQKDGTTEYELLHGVGKLAESITRREDGWLRFEVRPDFWGATVTVNLWKLPNRCSPPDGMSRCLSDGFLPTSPRHNYPKNQLGCAEKFTGRLLWGIQNFAVKFNEVITSKDARTLTRESGISHNPDATYRRREQHTIRGRRDIDDIVDASHSTTESIQSLDDAFFGTGKSACGGPLVQSVDGRPRRVGDPSGGSQATE